MAVHPEQVRNPLWLRTVLNCLTACAQNLLAAGHDSGMLVYKLERERPAYTLQVAFFLNDFQNSGMPFSPSEILYQVTIQQEGAGDTPATQMLYIKDRFILMTLAVLQSSIMVTVWFIWHLLQIFTSCGVSFSTGYSSPCHA